MEQRNAMNLACELEVPMEVQKLLSGVMERMPWESMECLIKDLSDSCLAYEAQLRLAELTAPFEGKSGMGQLAAMLAGACHTREKYASLGIPDHIFKATMGCFPRFLRETKQIKGEWVYDRAFWTWRQTSCLLFRLGTLEFEYMKWQGTPILSVHIPSDTLLVEGTLREAYGEAKDFWEKYGEALCLYGKPRAIRCGTWLLSPELYRLLPVNSGIRCFAEEYELVDFDPKNESFYRWLFEGKKEWNTLPEKTSLQRAVKAHLAAGGRIGSATGIWKGLSDK